MDETPFGFFRARDGIQLRYGWWPQAGKSDRGTLVVLGGRTEFMEKYLETIRRLTLRGYRVCSMDWRGQGLSDRMLSDPTRGYVRSYDQYVDDMAMLFETIVRPYGSRPVLVLSHSMGGNILLHYLSRFPGIVDKGVLLSPMIDIPMAPVPALLARWACRLMVRLGKADGNIPAGRRNGSISRTFEKNHLTHDRARFREIQKMIHENGQLAVTGVTFGWLDATFRAIDAINRPGVAGKVRIPLLLVTAGDDGIVDNHAIRSFAARVPVHQIVNIDGAFHEILQEKKEIQDEFWRAFDRFLDL